MHPEHPTPAQIPGLRKLWKEAFGDSEEFLDGFFSTAFAPDRCLCVCRGDRVLSALYWLDMTCGGAPVAYIYAVATARDHRGQGLCRNLMGCAHELLRRRGYAAAVLVPQEESLAAFYEVMGYTACCRNREKTIAAQGNLVSLRAVGAGEFQTLRRSLLPPDSLELSGEALAFLATQGEFFAGDGFTLAASRGETWVLGMEFLGDPALLPGITAALGCKEGRFRMPGQENAFAWWLPLTDNAPKPAYLGFAFD